VAHHNQWDAIADLYDEYVRATLDIPFFLKEATTTGGKVLELMCGTGRVSLPLIEAGVRLTCVDNAPCMLAGLRQKLQERGLAASVIEMDVRELALPGCFDLIFIPFHSFAELTAHEDQRRTLLRIRAQLAEGGRFICTMHNPPVRLRNVDGAVRLWGNFPLSEGRGKLLLWGAETHDADSGVVSGVQLFEIYDPEGVMEAKRMLELRFRLQGGDDFEALAREAGLEPVALYGDYAYGAFDAGQSRFMVWVLQKAAGLNG